MKIISFAAENIKRLKVVEITPTGNVVELVGPNGSGKTSVLDAILWALRGKRFVQAKPVKAGEETGKVVLGLGDKAVEYTVTRRFKVLDTGDYTTDVVVKTAAGMKGGQDVLENLYDSLALDPLEFARAAGDKRLAMLRDVISGVAKVDFYGIAKKRAEHYENRKDAGREIRATQARLEALPPADSTALPDPIDTVPLFDELSSIGDAVKAIEDERRLREIEEDSIGTIKRDRLRAEASIERRKSDHAQIMREIATLTSRADDITREIRETTAEVDRSTIEIERREKSLIDLPPLDTPPDATLIRARIAEAEAHNRRIANAKLLDTQRAELVGDLDRATKAQEAEDKAITDLDTKVREAIAAVKLPVRGLALGADDVELDGIPFDQASDAQQLRASMAIAMAMKPTLRVMRIRDGSLLDKEGMKIIGEVAAADDWQIWIERVESSGGPAIHLEDGHVKP